MITDLWHRPATIERNNFKFKSLSCWSYNIAVGCEHACRFCYVPEVSTRRMGGALAKYGVKDPDAEWGEYVFLRKWDEKAFERSLLNAAHTDPNTLNADGNNAIMLCTTTDPYQTGRLPQDSQNSQTQKLDFEFMSSGSAPDAERFQQQRNQLVRGALKHILENTNLNVRILTRSPLARLDFDLMKLFGNRLLFGMSLPTLNNKLAKIYEPKAPAPSQRLATLRAAKEAGLNVFVAVAPVYPECDDADMRATLEAVKELDPVTIFMEPINIRADNVARIEEHARSLGVTLNTEVFKTPQTWAKYAMDQMVGFEAHAKHLGIPESVLHLWPDQSLKNKVMPHEVAWLQSHWNKISAWPTS